MATIISRSAAFRFLTLGIWAVATVAGCSGPPSTAVPPTPIPTPAPAAAEFRIAILGDSLAAGLGLAEREAFPRVVEGTLRDNGFSVEVVNAGVSGDTTAGGLSRLDWVLRSEPEILVVELGGNDALRGQPVENTENNLREIVKRGMDAGARVVLLGMDVPSNYGPDYAQAFAEIYPRVAREEGALLVPGFVREVGVDPSLLQADGLHPTAEGQRLLAGTLVPYLESVLEELEIPASGNPTR